MKITGYEFSTILKLINMLANDAQKKGDEDSADVLFASIMLLLSLAKLHHNEVVLSFDDAALCSIVQHALATYVYFLDTTNAEDDEYDMYVHLLDEISSLYE